MIQWEKNYKKEIFIIKMKRMLIFIVFVYLIFFYLLIFVNKKYFSKIWFKIKDIIYLLLSWVVLLIILQTFYLSIWKWFELNLFFIQWKIEVNDIIHNMKNITNNISWIWKYSIIILFFSLIIPALLEEVWKFYFFKLITDKLWLIHKIQDAIYWISIVAIWFALSETFYYIVYLSWQLSDIELMKLFINRFIISTISHMFFSWIFAYWFIKSKFINYYILDNISITKWVKILKIIKKIPFLKINHISTLYGFYFLLHWFLISIIFHAIYNSLMSSNNIFIANLLVIIWIYVLYNIMNQTSNQIEYSWIISKIDAMNKIKILREKINKII